MSVVKVAKIDDAIPGFMVGGRIFWVKGTRSGVSYTKSLIFNPLMTHPAFLLDYA